MTNEASAITDEMRAAIGLESESWTVEVDKSSVRMFARAVGYTDPLFYDEAFSKSKGYRSLPCPPHYLGTPIFEPTQSDATSSAPKQMAQRFAVPFHRLLNGGTDIEYFNNGPEDAICAGDVLQASTKVVSINERYGSVGPMLIVSSETAYRRNGTIVAIQRGTLIHY